MNSGMFTAYGRTKIMVSVRTMTEQKKLEEQLYRAQKMASLGTLVGSIAHEFRNVLNVIIGFGSLIKEDLREDDPLMSDLKPILSTAQGATNLTESLLSFCRKKVNGQRLLNINDTIRCSRIILLKIIGENIKLETMLDDRELTVRMDSGQIEQVLINLVINARDAMPNGGQLSIQTKLVNLNRKITQRHCHETQQLYAMISVVDSGTGMDEVTRENLFEPFYTTKEPGKGTGLGLAVLNGIIKQHDGYIHVSSQEGQGTAFKIYLPIMNAKTDEMKLGYHRSVGLRGDAENPRLTDN
jgi:signal transduction histidine kinase